MLRLRQEHIDAFEEMHRQTFEDRMVRDIAERFFSQYESLGDEKVRERIREGVERAPNYEIDAPIDVAMFIRLMFGIRPDFDTSRKTSFAREILNQTDRPAGERLDEIKARARSEGISQPSK